MKNETVPNLDTMQLDEELQKACLEAILDVINPTLRSALELADSATFEPNEPESETDRAKTKFVIVYNTAQDTPKEWYDRMMREPNKRLMLTVLGLLTRYPKLEIRAEPRSAEKRVPREGGSEVEQIWSND